MKRMAVVLSLAVAFCFVLASVAQAGPSDPATKGYINNNVKNKKKATTIPIWQITQDGTKNSVAWVDAINPRFAVYDNGTSGDTNDDAVLDKETGLVWQRDPPGSEGDWFAALLHCYNLNLGGRMGWRMPTVEELSSLVDKSQTGQLKLPDGHPFSGIVATWHWSCTTDVSDGNYAYVVNFFSGAVFSTQKTDDAPYVWAVRGGPGHDAY